MRFLIDNLINNTEIELYKLEKQENEAMNIAMKSTEVRESKRIANNIRIQNIKQLRNHAKSLRDTKTKLKEMISIIATQETILKKQIKSMQKQTDNYEQKET